MKCSFGPKRLSHKTTAFLTAVFFIFSGISAPVSFAGTAALTRDDRQQLVPVVSYDPLAGAAPAATTPVPEIPSGVAIQNTNPLSAASPSVTSTGTLQPNIVPSAQSSSSPPVSVITNGDFLQKTSGNTLPDGWEPFWATTQSVPGYLSSYDGKTGVVDLSLSTAGRGMKQTYSTPITLDRFSLFDITFKIVTAALAGDGSYGIEAPVIFRVNVLRTDGSAYQVTKYFNYTGDANSGSNPNFVLVPQDQWVTRSFTAQALGLAAGDKLTEIDVLSGGWNRTSYVDSVNVYLDQVPPVTISLNGVESELPYGTDMTVAAVTDIAVDAYSWYLDGTLISGATTSNVTTGKLLTTGGHTLTVETTLGGVATSQATQFQVIDFSQYAQLDVADQYAPAKTVHWAQDVSTFTHSYWDPSTGTAIIQYYPITSNAYAYGDSLLLDRSYTAWNPPGQTQGHTYEDRTLVEFDLSRWYQLGFDPNRVQRVELLATVSGSGETFQGYDFSVGSMQVLEDGLFSSAQDDFNVSTISLQTVHNLQLNSTPLDLRFNVTGLLLNELALRDAWSGIVFKSDAANLSLMQLANLKLRVYYDTDSGSIPPSQPVVTSTVPAVTNQTAVILSGTKEANTSIWINGAQAVALNDSTAWTATVNLPAEVNNQINIAAKDPIGLVSTLKICTILRDTVVPTGSININANALYATSQAVTLNLSGADNSSGISAMSFSTDNTNWTAAEAYAVSKAFTLPAGDGTKTVYVKYFDKAGNASPVYSKNIILDATMPSGSIGINSGAPYATSTSVTLNLSGVDTGSGITTMSFSSDGATWSAAETYAATKTYALSSGDGTKTVYVRFYDKAGNMSQFSDSIVLDTLVPTGTVKVNGGVSYINQATVALNLSAADTGSGVSAMSFSTNGTTWGAAEAYMTTKAWIFASGDGAKSIYIKFLDNSGKWSAVTSVTVTLDTVKPSGSININSSALYATSQTVTLNLSGTDASSGISTMSFSTDNTNWTDPVAYVTSKTFTLPAGDGTKTIYVKYFDKAGNASLIYSKSIYLDVTQPAGSIAINSGATYATSTAVTLNLSGADLGSGIATMSFSTNNTTWTAAEAYAASKAFTLSTGDGNKTVYVRYYDKAGNVSQVFLSSIILDTLAPVGTVKVNGGVTFINQTAVMLDLSATDTTSGMNMMSFSTNNTTWTAAEAYATTKTWTFPTGDGAKTVYVKFQDKAGRWSAAVSVTVTMDTVKPTGSININLSALYATSQTVTLNLSGTDASSGISTMSFSTDNTNWTTPVAYATSKTFTLPAGDGTKTIYVKYYDKVGNESLGYSKSILLDMTQPTGTITINSGATYATSTAITLNLSGVDSGSGISTMSFSTNNTTWTAAEAYAASKAFTLPTGDGNKTVYVRYYDKAGNVSQVFSKSIILDTVAPVGTVKVNGGAAYINQTAVTLDLSATDAGTGVDKMCFSTNNSTWTTAEAYAAKKDWVFPTGDGAKTVYVKFQDKAGRWSAAVSVTVTMDTVKPTGSINVNSGVAYVSTQVVTLNLSGTDASSGISTMSFSSDNANWTAPVAYTTSKTFTLPVGDGTKTVYVKYYDKAGNVSLAYSKSILLDMTQPTGSITINSGATYATSTAVTLNLSGADSGSGIATMSFSTNNTTWTAAEAYAASKAFTLPTGDGNKTVYVRYYDKAGNVSQTFSNAIILDTLAPVGTVKVNGGVSYVNQTVVALDLSATDAGMGVDKMCFSANNTTWTAAEAYATTKTWTFPTGDGAKTVYVKFQDKAGRWSAAVSVAVTMDTVKPTGTININSSALYAASQTVTLNLSGTDASSGISTMSFSTDNTNWTTPVTYATSKAFTLPTGDGTKTVYVKYFDKVGNASLVYSKSIVLDMLPPEGTVKVNGGAAYISQATATLNLSATDAGLGVSMMSFSANGTTWSTAETYAATKTWTFPAGDGSKTVYVKFQDKTGKWSAIASVTVLLDTVKPAGTLSINNGASTVTSSEITLSLTGYDAGSGVDQMRFSADGGTGWSGWETFSTVAPFTLSAGNGTRQVQCQLKDKSGQISEVFTDSIVVEIPETVPWITATSNANYAFRVTQEGDVSRLELKCIPGGGITVLYSGTGDVPDTFDVTADGRMVIYEGDGNAYVQVIGNPEAKATVQGDLKSIQYYGYYVMLKTETQYPSGTVFQRATGITINTTAPQYVSSFYTTLITAGTGFYRDDTLGIAVQVEYYAGTGQYQAMIYSRYGGNDYSCSIVTLDLGHETGTSGGSFTLVDAVVAPNGETVLTIALDSPTFNRTYLVKNFKNSNMPTIVPLDGAATAVTHQGRFAIYNVRDNDGLTRTLWVDLETLEVIPDLPFVELVSPVITQSPTAANQWTLKLDQAMRGVRYEVQFTTNIASNAWQTAGSFVADRYGEVSWQDPAQDRGIPVSYRAVAKEITTATDLLTQINLLYFDSDFGLVESTHEYPLEAWLQRDITQPSNFGFYADLLATIAAGDLVTSNISKAEAIRRLDVLMTHLLQDQQNLNLGYKGLFPWLSFNGSDWTRMDDVYGRQVSFEDNTNFTNALAVAYGALLDDSLAGNTTVHGSGGILGKISAFIDNQREGYLAMFNSQTNTFSQTMQVSDGSLSGTIALVGAESSAPLLFLILQYGDTFPASAYAKLNFGTRSYTMQDLTVKDVVAPFSGAFQIYWPALLMPESENPDLRIMLESYTDVQLDFAERNGQPGLLSAGYDVWTDNLLNRYVSAFSWAGDNVTGVREGDSFHVKSDLTNAGIGVVFNDGSSKLAFEGSTMQLCYSSKTAIPNARIEFKKRIGGVLQTVYTEALSLENTGGAERTVSFTLPLNGVLGELTEIVFATSGGGPLDVTFHSFDTDRIGYNFPLGINEIALGPTVETTPSVYNLGAAHMFRPAQVEVLLQGLIADHRDLISNHGLWEGKNMTSGKVVNEQVFNNVVTFTLGMVGTGPSYMTRYLENKGLKAELESIWDPQAPVSVTGNSTAYNFSYSDATAVYKATSWKLNESVMASGREIRITYQSDTPITGARFELKHSLDNNVPAYSQSFDLPATGGVSGEFILNIPENFLYWGISEMVVIFPEAKGFPSASITGITVAPVGVVVPPGVVLDLRTPHLIKTKTLTVSYTVDGVAKTKLFENLQEGVNTLTITEGQTVVHWDVTVDTVAPVVVLDPGTSGLINTNSFTVYYKVDGVAMQKTFTGLQQGTNTVTITETDPAGNPTAVNWTVKVDMTGRDLLNGQLAIFSFDGGNVSSSLGSDPLHLTSTNLRGIGVSAITPVSEVTGHSIQIRYSSVTNCGAVKIEFKKRINGVLMVMGALYFSLENTGGIVRTVTMGPIPAGMPSNLDEITFVSQGSGSSLDMSLYDLVLYEPVQS